MLLRRLLVLYFTYGTSFVVAESQYTMCTPDACHQGLYQIAIGATLSPNDPSANVTAAQLLPGLYTTTSQPQNLLSLLSTSSATLSLSPGFNSSSTSPPFKIEQRPGLVLYNGETYTGHPTFLQLPSAPMNSTPVAANTSFALSNNVWAVTTVGSNNTTVIFWNAVPAIGELPKDISTSQSLNVIDLQSSTCSPPCSSAGVCSASSTCSCAKGFSGSSCEKCAEGFSGPRCQPSTPTAVNVTSGCNCVNGKCSKGKCACNIGWTTAKNGTACAQCAEGYYLTSGNCRICELGCSKCADDTGTCTSCQDGFIQNQADRTQCIQSPSLTSNGVPCPSGAFSSGSSCSPCSSSCGTCIGPSSNDCIQCPQKTSFFNGSCVTIEKNGVCSGTNGMIANNNKKMCDTCGAKCTTCEIPNFNDVSTIDQLKCTGCLPGFFLVNGQCIDKCPSGTLQSQNSATCEACSSECSTCAGTIDNCLTCKNQQPVLSGNCVSTCPDGFYNSNSTCLECHPDCASCSGSSFDQCLSCPPNRPVLNSGRCLWTCSSQKQYFNQSTSSCQSCDPSCASCSGPGANQCLTCSADSSILRNGTCIWGSCVVMPEFGACFPQTGEL